MVLLGTGVPCLLGFRSLGLCRGFIIYRIDVRQGYVSRLMASVFPLPGGTIPRRVHRLLALACMVGLQENFVFGEKFAPSHFLSLY